MLLHVSAARPEKFDAELPIEKDGVFLGTVYVELRPFLFEFLEFVSQKYELVVYSSGSDICCQPILDYIEQTRKYFDRRVYGNLVVFENACFSVKLYDFLLSGSRDYSNTVVVEACAATFALCARSGVPITPFKPVYNDPQDEDDELVLLARYLDTLSSCEDVGKEISQQVTEAVGIELNYV